jgi:two-component system, OmpR family, response regulator MtrA
MSWSDGLMMTTRKGMSRARPSVVRVQGVEIDPPRRRVRVEGRDVKLTDREFRLLHLLASNAGIVFSREALLTKLSRRSSTVTDRSVDALVKRLRRRVEPDSARPQYLLTVWGVGYKFSDGDGREQVS